MSLNAFFASASARFERMRGVRETHCASAAVGEFTAVLLALGNHRVDVDLDQHLG